MNCTVGLLPAAIDMLRHMALRTVIYRHGPVAAKGCIRSVMLLD